jgi:hypothetical protein
MGLGSSVTKEFRYGENPIKTMSAIKELVADFKEMYENGEKLIVECNLARFVASGLATCETEIGPVPIECLIRKGLEDAGLPADGTFVAGINHLKPYSSAFLEYRMNKVGTIFPVPLY